MKNLNNCMTGMSLKEMKEVSGGYIYALWPVLKWIFINV